MYPPEDIQCVSAQKLPTQESKDTFIDATYHSLINSIINGHPAPTEGKPEEATTVGIDVQSHDLENTTVEFYDCAGQLDYYGMHQIFLSKRALYLLVWDVSTYQDFSTRKNSELDKVYPVKYACSIIYINRLFQVRGFTILHCRFTLHACYVFLAPTP